MNAHYIFKFLRNRKDPAYGPLLAKADEPEEPPGAPQPLSEIERHSLVFSNGENRTLQANAFFTEFGTAGIIPTIVWYVTTPASQVGMGLALTATATTGVMIGTFAGTCLITIPLVYYGYKKILREATELNKAIEELEALRTKNRGELFFDLLRLRCLFDLDEANFNEYILSLPFDDDDHEIDSDKLIHTVNKYYLEIKQNPNKYQLQNIQPATVAPDQKESNSQHIFNYLRTHKFAQDNGTRTNILNVLRQKNPAFNREIDNCYKPVSKLSNRHFSPIGWGMVGTLVIASGTFGNMWTFAGMLVSAGLCASLPVIGWAIIGAACLAASIAVGYYIGKCVLKNLQREELKTKLINRNDTLSTIKNVVHKKCLATLDNEQKANHALRDRVLQQDVALQAADEARAANQKEIATLRAKLAAEQQANIALIAENRRLKSNIVPINRPEDKKDIQQERQLSRSAPSSPRLFAISAHRYKSSDQSPPTATFVYG